MKYNDSYDIDWNLTGKCRNGNITRLHLILWFCSWYSPLFTFFQKKKKTAQGLPGGEGKTTSALLKSRWLIPLLLISNTSPSLSRTSWQPGLNLKGLDWAVHFLSCRSHPAHPLLQRALTYSMFGCWEGLGGACELNTNITLLDSPVRETLELQR